MNEFIRSQWAKSKRSLAAAEATLDTDPDSAASRSYYAAFHRGTAVLAGRGMEFTKHTAVRAALYRDLIQSGAIPADLGRDYDFLLDLRETADYGGVAEASLASALRRRPHKAAPHPDRGPGTFRENLPAKVPGRPAKPTTPAPH